MGIINFSCDKSKKEEILYTNTDIDIHSVDQFTYFENTFTTCTIPVPDDSTINYKIDMDQDGDNDVMVNVVHYDKNYSHNHCLVYEYMITITGVTANDSIAESPKHFDYNDPVNDQVTWKDEILLYIKEGINSVDFPDCYIGIKISDKYGYIKVSKLENNGINIDEYAIRKEANVDIKCGEQ